MDLKLFATTFVTVFLAELGDKTQLATFAFSSGPSAQWTVFIAAASALVLSTAMAVLAGEALTRVVPVLWLHRLAGAAFLVIGAAMLWMNRKAG